MSLVGTASSASRRPRCRPCRGSPRRRRRRSGPRSRRPCRSSRASSIAARSIATSRLSSVWPAASRSSIAASKALADLVIGEEGELLAVALPEGLEHHPVGGLRAFEEAGDVEAGIGGDDRADAGGGALLIGEAARLGRYWRRRRRAVAAGGASGVGFGPGHRLLLVAGPLAEHGIEPEAHEQGDHGQAGRSRRSTNFSRGRPALHRPDAVAVSNPHWPQRSAAPDVAPPAALLLPAAHRLGADRLAPVQPLSKDEQHMAEDEWRPGRRRPAFRNGDDTLPQVGVLAQYVKDLSFENPNAPAVYQWQSQPQMDVQFNIGTQPSARTCTRSRSRSSRSAKGDRGRRLPDRAALCGPVRAPQHPRRAAPALPARRGAAPALPLRPQDHRRRVGRRRLPAAAARPDRFRRPLHAERRPGSRPRRPAARPET